MHLVYPDLGQNSIDPESTNVTVHIRESNLGLQKMVSRYKPWLLFKLLTCANGIELAVPWFPDISD